MATRLPAIFGLAASVTLVSLVPNSRVVEYENWGYDKEYNALNNTVRVRRSLPKTDQALLAPPKWSKAATCLYRKSHGRIELRGVRGWCNVWYHDADLELEVKACDKWDALPTDFGYMTGPHTGTCRDDVQNKEECRITRVAKNADGKYIVGYQELTMFKMSRINVDGTRVPDSSRYYQGVAPASPDAMVAKYDSSSQLRDNYHFVKGTGFSCGDPEAKDEGALTRISHACVADEACRAIYRSEDGEWRRCSSFSCRYRNADMNAYVFLQISQECYFCEDDGDIEKGKNPHESNSVQASLGGVLVAAALAAAG